MNDFLILFITFMLLAAAVAFLAALLILLPNNREEPGRRKDLRSALKNSFSLHLDAQKPLYRHLWFWVAALTPILVGISLGLPIWLEYNFSLSQVGYETFLEISKLPLYVMAPAVPLGMVVAAFHKTKQTAEQIKQTKSNNNFRNGSDHRKLFTETCEKRLSKMSAEKAHLWHEFMFSDAVSLGDLGISLKKSDFIGFDLSKTFFGIDFNYRDVSATTDPFKEIYQLLDSPKRNIDWLIFKRNFMEFSTNYSFLFDSLNHQGIAEKINEFCGFYEIACELNFSTDQKIDPWLSSLYGLRFISIKKENGFTSEMLDELLSGRSYLSDRNKEIIRSDFESNGELSSFNNAGLYLVSKKLHDKLKGMIQNTPA